MAWFLSWFPECVRFLSPLCRACVYLLQILAKTPTASRYRRGTMHAASVFCWCINLLELEALYYKKHVQICVPVSIKLSQRAASPVDLQRERERGIINIPVANFLTLGQE